MSFYEFFLWETVRKSVFLVKTEFYEDERTIYGRRMF